MVWVLRGNHTFDLSAVGAKVFPFSRRNAISGRFWGDSVGNNGRGMHFFIVKKWCKVSSYCGAKGSDVMAPVLADWGGEIDGGKFGHLPNCDFCQVVCPWEHAVYLNYVKWKCYVMFVYWKEGGRISVTSVINVDFFPPKNVMFCKIELFCPSQMRSAHLLFVCIFIHWCYTVMQTMYHPIQYIYSTLSITILYRCLLWIFESISADWKYFC